MEDRFKKTEYHLYSYKDIEKLNKLDEIKIKQIENDITLSAVQYDKDSISPTNAFHSNVEDEVIRRETHIKYKVNHLKNNIERRNLEKELIITSLTLLEDEEKKLVELRYFSKPTRSWDSIALEVNQSKDNCIKVRRKIIEQLSDYIL